MKGSYHQELEYKTYLTPPPHFYYFLHHSLCLYAALMPSVRKCNRSAIKVSIITLNVHVVLKRLTGGVFQHVAACVIHRCDWVSHSMSEWVSQSPSEWVSQWMGEAVSEMAGPGGKLPTHSMFVKSNWREGILPVCLSVCSRVTDVLEWDKRAELRWWRRVDPDLVSTLTPNPPPTSSSGARAAPSLLIIKREALKCRVESLILAPVALTAAAHTTPLLEVIQYDVRGTKTSMEVLRINLWGSLRGGFRCRVFVSDQDQSTLNSSKWLKSSKM